MISKEFVIHFVLTGLLCWATVQGGKQLCQEAPHFEETHAHLKKIEQDFQKAKLDAETLTAVLKKNGSPYLEEFEKEYHNFVNNYQVMIQLMEQKPSFCERLIQELDDSIKFFVGHTLTNIKTKLGPV